MNKEKLKKFCVSGHKILEKVEKIEQRLDSVEGMLSKTTISKSGTLIKCPCSYVWRTQSDALLISCPRCGNKVRKTQEKVKCFKCKKELEKSKAKYGYNEYFCKICYKEFDKQASKEVDRAFKEAENKGII